MLAAIPQHIVETSHLIYLIVSYIPIPAVTDPPGLLIYNEISFEGSSDSRNNNCAITRLAVASFTSSPRKMILSFSNLE